MAGDRLLIRIAICFYRVPVCLAFHQVVVICGNIQDTLYQGKATVAALAVNIISVRIFNGVPLQQHGSCRCLPGPYVFRNLQINQGHGKRIDVRKRAVLSSSLIIIKRTDLIEVGPATDKAAVQGLCSAYSLQERVFAVLLISAPDLVALCAGNARQLHHGGFAGGGLDLRDRRRTQAGNADHILVRLRKGDGPRLGFLICGEFIIICHAGCQAVVGCARLGDGFDQRIAAGCTLFSVQLVTIRVIDLIPAELNRIFGELLEREDLQHIRGIVADFRIRENRFVYSAQR